MTIRAMIVALHKLGRKYGDNTSVLYQTGTFPEEPKLVVAPDKTIRIDHE